MAVSHSLVGKTYQITNCGHLLAYVSKSDDGFTIEWATFTDYPAVFKTMASLKAKVSEDLPKHVQSPVKRHRHMSVQEACKRAGYSHNEISHAVANIKELWPHLPSNLYGDRIYRLAMEAQAAQPYGAYARRWLERNSKLGAYDKVKKLAREIELGWHDEY